MDRIDLAQMGRGVGLLRMQVWTCSCHKVQGISTIAEKLLASEEGLCSMESVSYVTMEIQHQYKNSFSYQQMHLLLNI